MFAFKEDLSIPVAKGVHLDGVLIIPEDPKGLVIFSHGSGSSRFSPRNSYVAQKLQEQHMATLLFDLLTEEEDEFRTKRFEIELLTERLEKATRWISQQNETQQLPIGFFGASTGAASALKAAARMGDKIKALVSRGGRPDLAIDEIPEVTAASLFIVGGDDHYVIQQNQKAFKLLNSIKQLEIVSGAGHLFEEPGALEKVADLAADWFNENLSLQI